MSTTPKVLEGYCPLPAARLSHLRKPRAINVHGKQLYMCQYTGELAPKAYSVTIYGVRQGSFKDMGCLLSFLASVINGPKSDLKEKKEAWDLYGDIIHTLSLENTPVPVAGSPLDLERFGGTLFRLDDKYTYHIPEMEPEMEQKWLYNPDIHTEHEIKPKEQRLEIQVPIGFTDDYFIVDYREASLLTLRTQVAAFLEENNQRVENIVFGFKQTPDVAQSEMAIAFVDETKKEARFVIRPYQSVNVTKKRAPRAKKTPPMTMEEKKDRKKALKKMDKENEKTIVKDIMNDRDELKKEEGEVSDSSNEKAVLPPPVKRARVAREKVLSIVKEMNENIEKQKKPRKSTPKKKETTDVVDVTVDVSV